MSKAIRIFRRLTLLFTATMLATLGAPLAQAETFGDYEIHYGTLTTDFLSPQVARQYGVSRSANTAMLSVAVLKREKNGTTRHVNADIQGTATNQYGQLRKLSLRRVQEGNAIYYIDTFHITPPERYTFELQVKPAGSNDQHRISVDRLFAG
ncbi:MAG: DUF4426 domain-containing protein [Pseudomonadota bacterium]|uniref:DUF4426 domain-containing protein n=1 Tax=Thermithiobacillus tepidarius TaxID=929 RepID=UPI000428C0B5|nr:DUF4426 domain-containing protein [Thermithiobacillus tepidarius]